MRVDESCRVSGWVRRMQCFFGDKQGSAPESLWPTAQGIEVLEALRQQVPQLFPFGGEIRSVVWVGFRYNRDLINYL